MSKITGTGCMTAALLGSVLGAKQEDTIKAAVTAVAAMGVAGEWAGQSLSLRHGICQYRNQIIDNIGILTGEKLNNMAKIELFER